MDTIFIYNRMRTEFGRQCIFWDRGPELIDNYPPQKEKHLHNYIQKDPVQRGTMLGKQFAWHEVNTERIEYENKMVSHMEGGWPRDVNYNDPEMTVRFRRKVEKDDYYMKTVINLSKRMERTIFQNNALDIYQQYYSDVVATPIVEKSNCRTVNVYRSPAPTRPVTNISWGHGGTHLAVTHCDMRFQGPAPAGNDCYIWDVENPNRPDHVMTPHIPVCWMEFSLKDPHVLCAGCWHGLVGFFDIRKGHNLVNTCPGETAHRDPVNRVLWINSKSGTEFFSASTDGMIKWWDTRRLTEPTEELILDISKTEDQLMSKALGCSALEYEPSMTTRFMVGTENGIVISGNRKGKNCIEKLATRFAAHHGPVYAVQRNVACLKNFITIGDWTVRIWAEDCKESSVVWTGSHRSTLRDVCWSPARFSVFFVVRDDGVLDCWDIMQQQNEPILSVKISDAPLRRLKAHEDGRILALGNSAGTVYLVEMSENMAMSTQRDKQFLIAMLDRESKREKIIEGRMREIRLKASGKPLQPPEGEEVQVYDESEELEYFQQPMIIAAESEYMESVTRDLLIYEGEKKEEPPPPELPPKGGKKKK